ncbi:alanine/ornithine racemase family PLP-dependent enzyme [uncultured Hoeflea sp.]|uniref:alanine/ornithine racemase family PLP-dependent enzyme n=1 Tax=uncultured Hoeflea sp. TaxID=538666 RepID=UPI002639E5B0|nr:alanine/ornithine racemase family PLP-dependent enzyme [uncultured Hoeflea sp.]
MATPRLEIDLGKIRQNARSLVERLKVRGIAVTGVTKAVCGHPGVARAMLDGGVSGLAEARISNVMRLRRAGITCPVSMIRTPLPSQLDDIVLNCQTSYNTEMSVIAGLASASMRMKTVHSIILMVEMGDMREGILPEHLGAVARQVLGMPGVVLKGIGANFACLQGQVPEASDMSDLSRIAKKLEVMFDFRLATISGGNSANLPWALGQDQPYRINDLRLGEAILLGVDPISGHPIDGLWTDAFALIAEVIETQANPEVFRLTKGDPATPCSAAGDAPVARSILAIGRQDTDVEGLTMPGSGVLVGATSDHTVMATSRQHPRVGSEVRFQMNYSALMHAMAAPDIVKVPLGEAQRPESRVLNPGRSRLALA